MAIAENVQFTGENLILDLLILFMKMEAEHRINSPASKRTGPESLDLHRKFLDFAIRGDWNGKKLSKNEKLTRSYLRHELRRTNALLNPTFFKRILFSKIFNSVFNRAAGRHSNYKYHRKIVDSFEKNTAAEVNLASLSQEMKDAGFRIKMDEPLSKMMAAGMKEFAFRYTDPHLKDTTYVLHFKKLPDTDAYFFEKFDALHRQTKQEISRGEKPLPLVSIYLSDKVKFNADEARQLAADRPLQKLVSGEKVFVVPDQHSPIGLKKLYFDLERELDNFSIKEMQPGGERTSFIADVAKGVEREVTMYVSDDRSEKMLIGMELNEERDNYQLKIKSPDGAPVESTKFSQNRQNARRVHSRLNEARKAKLRPSVRRSFAR